MWIRQNLSSKLAKTRQQLQKAQSRVAALEARLSEGLPNLADLAGSEARYRRTLDTMLEGCQIIGFDWRYLYVNDMAAHHGQRPKHELLGYTMMEAYPGVEKTGLFTVLQRSMQERCIARIENEFTYPDGTSAWFELNIQPVPEGIFILSLDITARKWAGETLRRSEVRFRSLVEAVEDYAIFMLDTSGYIASWNTGAERLKGYASTEIIGQPYSRFFMPEDQQSHKPQHLLQAAQRVGRVEDEGWRVRKDGSHFWANAVITALRDTDGSLYGFAKITRDLTQRKRTEENIRKLHRTLGVLSDINQAIVRIRHLPSLFDKACEIAVEKGDFRMAWLGLFDAKTGRLEPATAIGIADHDLEKLISTLHMPPLISALRDGARLICNDIQTDPTWLLWRAEALRLGYCATVALPLVVAGEVRGIFNLFAGETDFFDEPEMRLMDEMAGDISFAIEFAEQDEQRQRAEAAVTRYAARMEILHQIDQGIINANSIEEIVAVALQHIRRLIPCQRANVGLIDMAKGAGVIFAVDYDGDTALGQGVRIPIGPDFFDGYNAQHLKIVPDLHVLQEQNGHFKQAVQEGLRCGINLLLMDRDQPIGTFGLFANTPNFFTTEHQEIIIEVGSQLAVAIRQMQLAEQLAQHLATLEQKVVERTADLQATVLRVEAILNNSPDGILLVYGDLTIQQTNASFNTLFACEQDAYCGKSLVTLIHADDADTVTALVQAVITAQQGKRIEIRALRKNGTLFDAELRIGLIKGDGVVCALHDITERKQAQVALQKSAAEIHDLYNHAPCGYHSIDKDGLIVQINDTELQWLGYTRAEVIGRLRATALFTPESILVFQRTQPVFIERGWMNDVEVDMVRKDGSIMHILLNAIAIYDDEGQYQKSRSTLFDITELQQAQRAVVERETRYRLLAENISDVIAKMNPAGIRTFITPSCYALLGYTPEELIGQRHIDIVHPDDRPHALAAIQQAISDRKTTFSFIRRFRHKVGRDVWVEITNNIVYDRDRGVPLEIIGVFRDITERKQAEDALRESEEKFRLLLDVAPVATIISDQTGQITLVNGQAETLFGYMRSELTGKPIEVLVPDYASAGHVHNRMTYLDAPRIRPMGLGLELYARRKDGSGVPVEIELSYLKTQDAIMVMSFIMDITERKRIAAELEQQRSFLRNVIDVSPNMIFVKDYEGRFVLVNSSIATMYNTTIDGLIGKTDADFNSTPQEVANFLAADRLVITSGNMLFVEEPITNPLGKVHWLQTTKLPIVSADGQSKYVLGVSTDITERKEAEEALRASEEKYRLLVETMSGGLAVFDTEFRITYVNDRLCALFGYSRAEVLGMQPTALVDASYVPLVQSHMQHRQNAESTTYEIPIRHKDGHQIYVLMSGSPLLDRQGKYSGSIVVVTDITIQKQAEAALRQALAKEKELGDLKTRFVSMASHEFRTPLATILAVVETLSVYRQKLSEEQIDKRFDKIKDQVGHLKDIMEDVLLLARMQARHVEFNPVLLDLDALARSVLDEFQNQAEIKHLLDYLAIEGMHELFLDRKLMRQIISNLVSNAIKYSPAGTVVRMQLQYIDATVILTVSDEGIGIPEADLPHLFEPFHRATNVGTISGTGLGLVITREAVELHGGTITVESQQDVGTTFLIRIPIAGATAQKHDEHPDQ